MQAKLIEYAYPSSTIATKAGYSKTGCWFITLYPSIDACFGEEKTGHYFLKKEDAIAKADSMPEPYNNMHKYFNS